MCNALDGARSVTRIDPERQVDLIVREAREDDAAAVLGVLNPIIESEAVAFDAPLTEADERSYLANFPSRGVFHVALQALHTGNEGFVGWAEIGDHVNTLCP